MKKHLKRIGLFVGGAVILFLAGFFTGYDYGYRLLVPILDCFPSKWELVEFSKDNKDWLRANERLMRVPSIDLEKKDYIIRLYLSSSFEISKFLEVQKTKDSIIVTIKENNYESLENTFYETMISLHRKYSEFFLDSLLTVDYCNIKSVDLIYSLNALNISFLKRYHVFYDNSSFLIDYLSKECSNQVYFDVMDLENFPDPVYQKLVDSFLKALNSIKNDSLLSNTGKD
jgi:hypothetical protein